MSKKKRITPAQKRALDFLVQKNDWASPSEVGAKHNTLTALVHLGLVKRNEDGPLKFKITGDARPKRFVALVYGFKTEKDANRFRSTCPGKNLCAVRQDRSTRELFGESP